MSEITLKAWTSQESSEFENFNLVTAARVEEAIFAAIAEDLKTKLTKSDSASITLPWGTYTASGKSKGDNGNIAISWEPSKGFLKMLSGDESKSNIVQDDFEAQYTELFRDYVAYGFFYPNAPENKDRKADLYFMLHDDEIEYFLNSYAYMLSAVARDKEREGKIFRLDIEGHGTFSFEFEDSEVTVKFVPDKAFKQALKNDSAVA